MVGGGVCNDPDSFRSPPYTSQYMSLNPMCGSSVGGTSKNKRASPLEVDNPSNKKVASIEECVNEIRDSVTRFEGCNDDADLKEVF